MPVLVNRAKMSTSTTGTGTITLGSAVSGFQTFADAGISDGQTVRYVIEDGANFEIGNGTYGSSGTTLSRSVIESSNSDSAISLSGDAFVFIGAIARDITSDVAITGGSITGITDLALADGGTGASTASAARDNLGLGTSDSPTFNGSNITNVQAASVNVTESTDDNVDYNVLFSNTASSGTVQMTPQQDDNGLTFNPSTNYLYSQYAKHSQVGIDSYLFHNGDTNTYLVFDTNDSIKLGTNGAARLHITNSGLDVTGTVTDDGATHDGDVTFTGADYNVVWDKSDNALEFGDNAKAIFGAGSDLQIFHDSSNNHSRIVESGSGNLRIEASHFVVQNASNTESMIIAYENAAVELYHNNSRKLATTSTGISVTGNIVVSGTVDGKDVSTLTTATEAADEATALAIALG